MSLSVALRQTIWERAGKCCEYCQMPQDYDPATFEVDHIVPGKMGGESVEENLALACFKCNNHKGPNIAGIDPMDGSKAFLFDPRNDNWSQHFIWDGPLLLGLTSKGRTTVALLQMNVGHRVSHRRQLITEGVFPLSKKS
ncbi:HNH endonuclease [Rosistilla oblonga]|uniref:HNH endonuclease n=1 Tax=Rosistilla oblonga TaxID=2527990 RepID=UPI003A97C51F